MAIVRLSGPQSLDILSALVERKRGSSSWKSHHMYLGLVKDSAGALLDQVLAVFMPGPHSYTGEDTAEIHCHGGRLLPHLILDRCLELGARLATPGEYTLRSFLNGKIDLAQSEAVLGLIHAGSSGEVRLNAEGLQGALSQRVAKLRGRLLDLVARIEAEIDFGEEVEGVGADEQQRLAQEVAQDIAQVLANARCGDALAHGVNVALSGPPNAGKSTLWNKLLGEERALVTPVPGTTRDSLEANCTVGGVFIHIIDTAGLHESDDYVENLGMERTRAAVRRAELNLIVLDGSRPWSAENEELIALTLGEPLLVVLNKRDLGQAISAEQAAAKFNISAAQVLSVSLIDDSDVPRIEQMLAEQAQSALRGYSAGALSVNQRQMQALVRAQECLQDYAQGVEMMMPSDCLLSDLHRALGYLGEITGANVSEDIIDQVFAKFCLGK